ncbi:hypothetical protein KC19_12G027300 [Ceratodon purpureus]|uniref:Uncharacterized protein n=1 Tax=Ceratodon purpureus TaxID=3225 RepID=A0A8T0G6C2_CERPU|nr:hypothetical protein KC19_12G027300 [Ceratodon purpureus]
MASGILRTIWSWIFKAKVAYTDTSSLASAETLELYLTLTTKCMEEVDRMTMVSAALKFNQEQCDYLAEKLKVAVRSAHSYLEVISLWRSPSASTDNEIETRALEVFKLLFALGMEVETFIKGCCKDTWIQSAILMTNMSVGTGMICV